MTIEYKLDHRCKHELSGPLTDDAETRNTIEFEDYEDKGDSMSSKNDEHIELPDEEGATTASKFAPPGAPRKPRESIINSVLWLYGPPKIGKTTLASKFPGAWFLATEQGQEWVEVRQPTLIESWDEFLDWCNYMHKNMPKKFSNGQSIHTIVIDTIDLLFKMCSDHTCTALGIEDPSEEPHGKGWARLGNEFERVISRIVRWPYGFVFISHSRERLFKRRSMETSKIEPDMTKPGLRTLSSVADLIMYAHTHEQVQYDDEGNPQEIEEIRALLCHPTDWAIAGGRMSHLLPDRVVMDYEALMAYFPATPTEEPVKEKTSKKRSKK